MGSCKNGYLQIPSTCDSECNKACKNDDYVDIKICLCEKRQFDKLILTFEIEVLNTTEILLNYKKITCEKSNCLIHIISLVIICLSLLFVISISCYFYYTKYWSKQKHLLPYHGTSNKLKGIDINNIF